MVRILPNDPYGHWLLARILAASPVAAVRDGKRAVAEATIACQLTHGKDPDCLDALAAACAEAGDFDSAVKWETQAIDLEQERNRHTVDFQKEFRMRDRLSLYKRRQPYRVKPDDGDPPRPPAIEKPIGLIDRGRRTFPLGFPTPPPLG
jgi:hypothetical protein